MLNPEYYDEDDDVYYSEVTGKSYCDSDCRDEAEEAYKKENWHYSDFDDDWYEDKDDIVTYQKFNHITCQYEEKTITKDSYFDLIDNNELHPWGGLYFDVINEEVGKPYGYETLLEFNIAA